MQATHLRRLCFVLLCLWAASAIARPQEPPPKAEAKCTIEGLVLKAGSSEPIRRAQVMLIREGGPGQTTRVVSDAAGRFVFRDVSAGRYYLSAERQGYVRQTYGQRTPMQTGSPLQLAPGQHVRDVVFRLVPWAVVSGRVTDEEGEAVVGGMVEVMRFTYVRGRRQLVRMQSAGTNDLGEYRIYGLPPGRYYLSAAYFGGGRVYSSGGAVIGGIVGRQSTTDESYAPTYYPGTNDPARAIPLELGPGQDVSGLDFTLRPLPTVRVRGRVIHGITGQPVRGATLWLFPRESELRPFSLGNQAMSDSAQGEFEIRGVLPGSYFLAAGWGEQGRSFSARVPVEVGSTHVEGLTITLTPSVTLEGRVRVEGGGETRFRGVQIQVVPSEEAPMGISNASTRPDGAFSFRDLVPGIYTLNLSGAPEGYYLKSATLGGKNVLEAGVDLSGGSSSVPLELLLSPAAGRIDGIVVSDEQQPVPGAQVAIVPDKPHRKQWYLYQLVTADASGRFVLQGLAPGAYKLFAWQELEPGAHMDPEFLRPYEDRGVVIRVEESSRYTQELKLLPPDARSP
jgi:hypothetical protein